MGELIAAFVGIIIAIVIICVVHWFVKKSMEPTQKVIDQLDQIEKDLKADDNVNKACAKIEKMYIDGDFF